MESKITRVVTGVPKTTVVANWLRARGWRIRVVDTSFGPSQRRQEDDPHIALFGVDNEIFHIRDHSLYTPRDFDVSPYFDVIKPSVAQGFNYKQLTWDADPAHLPSA